MVMSEGFLQMQLARDNDFLTRLQYLMVQQARVVKEEPLNTPSHQQRSSYATSVINNPQSMAMGAATTIVGGPNLIGTVTMEDSGPVTSATDAAITAQIGAFWNSLAGIDSGATS